MREHALSRLRRRLWIERALFVLVIGAGLAYHFGVLPGGRRVCLIAADGHPVAVVNTRGDARRLLDEVGRAAGQAGEVRFAEKVTLQSVPAGQNPVISDAAAMAALASKLHPVIPGAAILADDELVVGLPSRQEAVRALSLLQRAFAPPGPGVTTMFRENVHVDARDVPVDKMAASAQTAVDMIRAGLKPKGVHEVKPGESAWKIALDSHVSLSRLAQANPDLDMERLRAGDRLNLPSEGAPITVIARKEVQEAVGVGPRRSLQVVRVTYENGAVVSREIVGHRRVPSAPRAPATIPARRGGHQGGPRPEVVP